MKKKVIIVAAILFFVAVVAIGGVTAFMASPVSSDESLASFSIAQGDDLDKVTNKLQQQGLIRSALFLKIYAKIRGNDKNFKAGEYMIPRNGSAFAVHDLLVKGTQSYARVTIPEGYTVSQIAAKLEESKICSAADFLKAASDGEVLKKAKVPTGSVQGFLYPDTYRFAPGSNAQDVVLFMVETFWRKLADIAPAASSLDASELKKKIVLASIVEREYRAPSDAPLIASVFLNRIKINMRLESCATVVYAMTEEYKLPHPSRLLFKDLKIESEYNTYLHKGLPPNAICNPGTVAIQAAFNPADTSYLYFVLEGPTATQHHFSKTLSEHLEAKVFYLK